MCCQKREGRFNKWVVQTSVRSLGSRHSFFNIRSGKKQGGLCCAFAVIIQKRSIEGGRSTHCQVCESPAANHLFQTCLIAPRMTTCDSKSEGSSDCLMKGRGCVEPTWQCTPDSDTNFLPSDYRRLSPLRSDVCRK